MVAGLGIAGLAAARALAKRGDPVAVWAEAIHPVLEPAAGELRAAGVAVTTGGDGTGELHRSPHPRCLVKSPGIPSHNPLVTAAAAAGVEVIDEAELGWRLDHRPLIGVTGTNGKSTVCGLVARLLEDAGAAVATGGNAEGGPALTALAANDEAEVIVCELSSYQLEYAPELLPDLAVLTNCTHDSWDRHGGRERYAAAKRRLLVRGERAVGRAVVPHDDPLGAEVARAAAERGARVVSFGENPEAGVRILAVPASLDGGQVDLKVGSRTVAVQTRLAGAHNARNVAAALAVAVALDLDLAGAARAIGAAEPVPGRLQRVPSSAPFDSFVDYAHNPDGLRQVLAAVRDELIDRGRGRIVAVASAMAVFDPGQYEAMACELAAGADSVVATTERFSSAAPLEEPPAFFAALRSARPDVTIEIDRAAAIRAGVALACPGDVLLVLGRGRRRTPIFSPGAGASSATDEESLVAALEAAE